MKDKNVKPFNMTTKQHETKSVTEHISCDSKYKFNSTTCNQNQKQNNETWQCEYINYHKC